MRDVRPFVMPRPSMRDMRPVFMPRLGMSEACYYI
jgi:hypothetical protein